MPGCGPRVVGRGVCEECTDVGVGFRVGCGITSDSDPEAETRETEAKALKLIDAIGVEGT
jgi:anthranilate/para-aminobenzoate synthase component I